MEMNLTQYYVEIIVIACLIVGYIMKKWIKDVDNKFIPTVVCVLGAVLNIVISGLSVESVVYGALSGLASTGLHQLIKQITEPGARKEEEGC